MLLNPTSPNSHIVKIACLSLLATLTCVSLHASKISDWEALKEKAKWRERSLMINGDGSEFFGYNDTAICDPWTAVESYPLLLALPASYLHPKPEYSKEILGKFDAPNWGKPPAGVCDILRQRFPQFGFTPPLSEQEQSLFKEAVTTDLKAANSEINRMAEDAIKDFDINRFKHRFLDVFGQTYRNMGVDTLLWCGTAGTFGKYFHPVSDSGGSMMDEQSGAYFRRLFGDRKHHFNPLTALLRAGTDPLRMQVESAHTNGMEFFWSMRMNDIHDGNKDYGYTRLSDWKKKQLFDEDGQLLSNSDPRFMAHLVGPGGRSPTSANYADKIVRDMVEDTITYVSKHYDVDGIELDYFRHLYLFASQNRKQTVTDNEREALTQMMRNIRDKTEQIGKARGRPLLLAIRVPDSPAYCREIGIDLETWLEEGLVDLLNVSGYFRLRDWGKSVALGKKYNLPVYASLDESRIPYKERPDRNDEPVLRARLLEAMAAGVDGAYIFNFQLAKDWERVFVSKSDHTYDLDKPARFYPSYRKLKYDAFKYLPKGNMQDFIERKIVSPIVHSDPWAEFIVLAPGEAETVNLNVAHPSLDKANATLLLRFEESPQSNNQITIHLNEQAIEFASLAHQTASLRIELPAGIIKKGRNSLTIQNSSQSKAVTWKDAAIEIVSL